MPITVCPLEEIICSCSNSTYRNLKQLPRFGHPPFHGEAKFRLELIACWGGSTQKEAHFPAHYFSDAIMALTHSSNLGKGGKAVLKIPGVMIQKDFTVPFAE